MRDYQRSRVYAWERECLFPLYSNETNLSLEDCYNIIKEAASKAFWVKFRAGCISLSDGRGHRNAVSYGGTIALPRWARQTMVVLHELAHEICPSQEMHGPQFVHTYIRLVNLVTGRCKEAMRREAVDMGVDCQPFFR